MTNIYIKLGLFSTGILVKLFILHYYMGITEGFVTITLTNFLMILTIFMLASITKKNRILEIYLVLNITLSVLFFIDVMYYSHFFTLAPAHGVFQIGQLGPVSNSILYLIRPWYFLLFLDSFLLWKYYKKNKVNVIFNRREKISFITISLLIFLILGLSYQNTKENVGNYTPYNLGVINYHIYDVVNLLTQTPVDLELLEVVSDNIAPYSQVKRKFGLAQNRNIIVIQAESVQTFVINEEINGQAITPVLNSLINQESIYFSRYYEQAGWGNTSDAEFISHNSFYPSLSTFSYKAYEMNDFATLPMLLKESGYSTMAFHGNNASFWNRKNIYPSQGIDTFISLEELHQDEIIGIGLSDGSLFRQSIDFLRKLSQPFYAFYITLTSHHPFIMDEAHKGLTITGEYQDTLLEDYLQTVYYLDKEIGNLIDMLKVEGLYDNSMIIIYGDHQGLDMRNKEANQLLSDFLGKPYQEEEMFRVPLIIHIPNSQIKEEITIAGGQIDFFPTIANLVGIDLKPDRVFGKDLLNTYEGFVAKQVHVARGSFIDNEKIFIMSNDGIFENSRSWNIVTGEPIDLEESRAGYYQAIAEVMLSEYILQHNLVPLVREKGLQHIINTITESFDY